MATSMQPMGGRPVQIACRTGRLAAVATVMASFIASVPAATTATDDFARAASWAPPPVADVRAEALDWLADRVADDPAAAMTVERGRAAWDARGSGAGFDLLDAVMEVLALGEPRIAEVWEAAGGPGLATAGRATSATPLPTDEPWLDDPAIAGFEQDAVRLWLGRQLVRHERFDEALPLLAGLDVATVVDPAALLFHRAACLHWMLESEEAIDTLEQLLERADDIPVRYERVARLLRADMAALEDESLDHVARRMRDITRRLGLGRAGADTRRVQDGVIASLDRMIKDLEDQQQQQDQQQSAGSGGGGGGQGGAGSPLDESRLAGGGGPGEVKNRDLGGGDGWGNLPPQAREESLQQIGREFPPHYREAIEQYFKRLATGGEAR
jgi:hypothetical protein